MNARPSAPLTDSTDTHADRWLRRFDLTPERLAEAAAGASTSGEAGAVARIKLGYNPNSSSVGSVITTLLWSATVGAAVVNIAASLIRTAAEDGIRVVGSDPPKHS